MIVSSEPMEPSSMLYSSTSVTNRVLSKPHAKVMTKNIAVASDLARCSFTFAAVMKKTVAAEA